MKIRFQSRHGISHVEARDFMGSDLTVWENGQERDIPDDLMVPFRAADFSVDRRKAVDAVLSLGPDWVDVATGTNPLFTCARCGASTNDDYLDDPMTGKQVWFKDEDGAKLCMTDFLAEHPEHEAFLRYRGLDPKIIADAAAKPEREAAIKKRNDAIEAEAKAASDLANVPPKAPSVPPEPAFVPSPAASVPPIDPETEEN